MQAQVGIWWDDGKTLAVIAHSVHEQSHWGILIDSNLTHVEVWPGIAGQFGYTPDCEYFVIPRGRVLLDPKTLAGWIYHGSSTPLARLTIIAQAFNLASWRARLDMHYEIC
jgi:hypothetical protein